MKKLDISKILRWTSQNWPFPVISFLAAAGTGYAEYTVNNIATLVCFVLSCIAALFFIVAKIYTSLHTTVPYLFDCTVTDARKLLFDNELTFDKYFMQPDHEIIHDQNPMPNAYVRKGTCIDVKTSEQVNNEISIAPGIKEFRILLTKKRNASKELLNGEYQNISYENDGMYSGCYVKGLPHGKGRYEVLLDDSESGLKKGDIYVGDWKNGKMNGEGSYTWENGDSYSGDIVNNMREGKGIYIQADGYRYVGNWVNNVREGEGTLTWPDGMQYCGNWVNNKLEGQGTLSFPDGKQYCGNWFDNIMEGEGTFTYTNGRQYVGNFVHGTQDGHGIFTWPDGSKYVGAFSKGVFNGIGKFSFGENSKRIGDSFEGWHVNGQRNGHGILKSANGKYLVGTWKDNKQDGTFLCYDKGGQLIREVKYINGEQQ